MQAENAVLRSLGCQWLTAIRSDGALAGRGRRRMAWRLPGLKGTAPCVLALSALCACSAALGGTIDKELQSHLQAAQPGDEVAVIIALVGKADVSGIRNLPELIHRKRLPEVLRAHAQSSQAPLIHYVKEQGGKNLHTIWVTNLLAAIVPSELVPSIAARPDVAAVRLDEQIRLTGHPMAGESGLDPKGR